MSDRASLREKLLGVLEEVNFDHRYFEYYQAHADRERQPMLKAGRADLEEALSRTGLDFTYVAKEGFFRHLEDHEEFEIVLNVAFSHSMAEFILYLRTDVGSVGGPFPGLARDVAKRRDPNFTISPASPKLPFSNEDELREVVTLGTSLFEDARKAIVSAAPWKGQEYRQ